jgi:hypothetical protein
MKNYQLLYARVKKFFREAQQTGWGKNQIVKALEDMELDFLEKEAKKKK